MKNLPARWNVLVVVLALATMLGCQGLSTGKTALQSTTTPPPGALSAAPSRVAFGNVQTGTSQSLSETLSNTGGASLTITQATVSGAGFSTTGLNLPLTLAPGQSSTFSIVLNPQSVASASGNLAITYNDSSSPLNIALSGTPVAAGSLMGNPTSFSFGNVQVGASRTLTETLKNAGNENLTISQMTFSGAGFSHSGLTLPLTLLPNQSATFGVVFTPSTAGAADGILSITTDGLSAALDLALSGIGVSPSQGTLSVNSVNVGNVEVGTGGTHTGTLTATGASVSVFSVSMGGANASEFSVSGLSFPVAVTPSQPVSFTVTFAPGASGAASAKASFASSASNSPSAATLTGTGTVSTVYSVSLSWTASTTSSVTSYKVYRAVYGGSGCGSFSNIGSTPGSVTTYIDSVVQDGTTYCYATTAVDESGESGYSDITRAVIPAP
jgi:Abnormal spindle-like microcephaly-assoc'd, ASPM-SPD-2-Hydin